MEKDDRKKLLPKGENGARLTSDKKQDEQKSSFWGNGIFLLIQNNEEILNVSLKGSDIKQVLAKNIFDNPQLNHTFLFQIPAINPIADYPPDTILLKTRMRYGEISYQEKQVKERVNNWLPSEKEKSDLKVYHPTTRDGTGMETSKFKLLSLMSFLVVTAVGRTKCRCWVKTKG